MFQFEIYYLLYMCERAHPFTNNASVLHVLCICDDLTNMALPPLGSIHSQAHHHPKLIVQCIQKQATLNCVHMGTREPPSPSSVSSIIGTLHNTYASAAKQAASTHLKQLPSMPRHAYFMPGSIKSQRNQECLARQLGQLCALLLFQFTHFCFVAGSGTEQAKLVFISNLHAVVSHFQVIPNKFLSDDSRWSVHVFVTISIQSDHSSLVEFVTACLPVCARVTSC